MEDAELEPQDAAARVSEGWQLVDVREDQERAAVRIGGDRHIAMADLTQRAGEIDQEKPVVFYCRVGNRSGMAADAFRGAGYDAHNLAGGIEAWRAGQVEAQTVRL